MSKNTDSDISEQLGLFDKLPTECLACLKEFDKSDKDMVMSWNVVVREETSTVRLYCPDCWELAQNAIKTLREEIENASEQN